MTRNYDKVQRIFQRDVAGEMPAGNLNRIVPAAVDINWVDEQRIEQEQYDRRWRDSKPVSDVAEELTLLAQQRLAKVLLKILYPTADGRLRVSKRKLTALFTKIGVSV